MTVKKTKEEKSRIAKRSKRKGSSAERSTAKILKEWWGRGEWAKTPLSGGWSRAPGFNVAGDIVTTEKDFPWCVENKKVEKWELNQVLTNGSPIFLAWWQQASEQSPPNLAPLLIASKNRTQPIIAMKLDNWLDLLHNLPSDPYMVLHVNGEKLVITSLKTLTNIDPKTVKGYAIPEV